MNITLEEVAFMGDDLGDMLLLEKVGISGAPANAATYVKKLASIVTEKKGGDGAFREFVETILEKEGKMTEVLDKYKEFTGQATQ